MTIRENNNQRWLDFEQFRAHLEKSEVQEYPNRVLAEMPEPKVSVMLITYQHKDYIRDALESVLMQKTNFPFEILIGDDDSTDGTREICIEYAKKFPDKIRLFLHKQENKIQIMGIACGIFQITYNLYNLRGTYMAVLSGDDFWTDPYKLQKQYDFLSQNPDYSYCYTPWIDRLIDSEGQTLSETTKADFPKASTMMGLNCFNPLPAEFCKAVQEDYFMLCILERYGKSKLMDNVEPTVYRLHQSNVWAKLETDTMILHKINSAKQIYLAFKGLDDAKKYGKRAIKYFVRNRKTIGNSYSLARLTNSFTEIWLLRTYIYYKLKHWAKNILDNLGTCYRLIVQ